MGTKKSRKACEFHIMSSVIHPDFVFVHFPRAGGTFVSEFLLENTPGCKIAHEYSHCGLDFLRFALKDDLANRFKFGFIRNPFDLYVSHWQRFGPHLFTNFKHVNVSFHTYILHDISVRHEAQFGRVRNWVTHGIMTLYYAMMYCQLSNPNHADDNRFCFSVDNMNVMRADAILRVEDGIESELHRIFNEHIFTLNDKQVDALYAKGKVDPTNHLHYSRYYGKQLREIIEREESFILEKFNYKFEEK